MEPFSDKEGLIPDLAKMLFQHRFEESGKETEGVAEENSDERGGEGGGESNPKRDRSASTLSDSNPFPGGPPSIDQELGRSDQSADAVVTRFKAQEEWNPETIHPADPLDRHF